MELKLAFKDVYLFLETRGELFIVISVVNPLLSFSIFGVLMSEYFAALSTKSSFIITILY